MNFIELEREISTTNYLIQRLISSGWMEKDVVIVNCAPEYSSRLTQMINHKTSYLNKNELYEQIVLDMPKKGMNQVLDYEENEFVSFDRYLLWWMKRHVTSNAKFLFVTNSVFTGKNLNKIRLSMKGKVENLDNIKFLALYAQEDSLFTPDYIGYFFKQDNPPVFFWENKN